MAPSNSSNDSTAVHVDGDFDNGSLTSTERYVALHGVDQERDARLAGIWNSMQGKLFERDIHQRLLNEAYQRNILGGLKEEPLREVVLITGPSGTGKSFLARSIFGDAAQDDVYILFGKCDFQQRNEPLAPFVHAFSEFVEEMLLRGEKDPGILAAVKDAIAKTTQDSDVDFLTDIIPSFARLLDPSKPTEKNSDWAPGGDTKKRANITRPNSDAPGITILCKLLQTLCSSPDFRILLFIDDLQWLDAKSIQLFRRIASTSLPRFMLLGTCRGNEVDLQADLAEMLRNIEDEGVRITDIQVENLKVESICNMMQQMLQADDAKDLASLAFLAFRLTNGNPFFVVELVRSLFVDRLLNMDKDGKWAWNEAEILSKNKCLENEEISDAIIEGLIRDDCDPMRETLQIASCLGAEFSLQHMKVACSQPGVVSRALQVLVYRRIVLTTKEEGKYHWAHDRFQASAFQLIPENEQTRFKCAVALRLLDHFTEEDLVEHAFLVVGLLFGGEDLFESDREKERIAELYSIAGVKAAQSSAFEEAAVYFRKGIDLLPRDHWQRTALYSTCQQLYNSLAEMECCLGHTAEVERLCDLILRHSRCLQDQMRAYDTKIYSLSYCNQMYESVQVALQVLRKLGEPVPHKVGLFLNMKELITTRRMLNRLTCEDILRLPPLTDWKKVAVLQILNIVFAAVLRCQPDFALFLTAKAIKITIRHGLSPLSAVLFSMFGIILCNPIGAVEEGLRLAHIANQIFENFQANDLRCRMLVIRHTYATPWSLSTNVCMPHILTGASAGMMTGDFEMAFIGSYVYCIDGLLCGAPLEQHYEKMQRVKEYYTPLGQETVMFYLDGTIQLALNLMGRAKDVHVLSGEGFDEHEKWEYCVATKNICGFSYITIPKLFLALFTDDYEEAVAMTRRLEKLPRESLTANDVQYVPFLSALSEMFMARRSKRRKYLREADRFLKRLENLTRHHKDNSWVNRINFIKAERDAFNGLNEEAIRKFFLSIEMAHQHGWRHEEALAFERLGHIYTEMDHPEKARDCYCKALDLYERWGCVIKCKKLANLVSEGQESPLRCEKRTETQSCGDDAE
jgi:predicted ATPase